MADIYRIAERLMGMDNAVWERHANPWSVWTRVVTPLPLLAIAIWSRAWLGWGALIPLTLVVLWIWLNPRLFPAPANFDGWASKGVLGERVFLRKRSTIAPHHLRVTRILTGLSGLGALPFAYGLWIYDIWAVIAGGVLITGGKMWFVDRMAWIWQDFTENGGTRADLDQ